MRPPPTTWRTPATVPELHQLAPDDPAVLALERPAELGAPLPPPPAVAAWSEDSGDPLADLGGPGPLYSVREANAILRAAAPRPPGAELEARVERLERELEALRGRSLVRRLLSFLRRHFAGA
jgi:hypothetical protein